MRTIYLYLPASWLLEASPCAMLSIKHMVITTFIEGTQSRVISINNNEASGSSTFKSNIYDATAL